MSQPHSHGNQNDEKKQGYYTGDIHYQFVEEHHVPGNVKVILRTFWILLFVSMGEVGIAFRSISKDILLVVFVVLTIVIEYFIIGDKGNGKGNFQVIFVKQKLPYRHTY